MRRAAIPAVRPPFKPIGGEHVERCVPAASGEAERRQPLVLY